MHITHTVSPQEDGMTLHALLRGPLHLTAGQTRTAKAKGAVTVDAAPFFANQPVRCGMVVRVALCGYEGNMPPLPPDLPPVRVLYEDDALLAVYKPALLQCHPSSSAPGGSDTLEARVQAYLRAGAHPVHRLDAETTGIVLFAKLPYAQAHLQRQMQAGGFQKRYEAWACGVPRPAQGEVDAPIAPTSPGSFTRAVCPQGQRAVSRYRVLRTLTRPSGGEIVSLLSLAPVTGRTHQLRVHMAHIGCPLLGDTRYGTTDSLALSRALGVPHHQLCAVELRFAHPLSGQAIRIACDAAFSPGVGEFPGFFPLTI